VKSRFEFSGAEIEALDRAVTERLVEFFSRLPSLSPMGSAHDPSANFIRDTWVDPLAHSPAAPEIPSSFEDALDSVFRNLVPESQLPGHPGYMAYVAGSGNHLSSLAQMIAMDLNPFSGHQMMAPGLVALELEALNWMKSIVGFSLDSAGFFTTGSSLATLSAIHTAREAKQPRDWQRGTIYVSDQSHHANVKAARIAGFGPENIRVIKSEPGSYRMDLRSLKEQIVTDRAAGDKPFLVIGNAGTTNTGAVDDLTSLAQIACDEGLWFHCDGAYGALFRVTTRGQARLQGLERADSLCFDLHKSFALPYGTGALLVREGAHLKTAHSAVSGSYMPPKPGAGSALVDFADLSPELSRDWRGLRVWLPIKVLGLKPFRDNLDEKLDLIRMVADAIKETPGLELLCEPDLTILAFAVKPSADVATDALLTRINSRGRIFLSGCDLHGRRAIRVCLLSFRAHEREARLAVEEIRDSLRELDLNRRKPTR
jgi:aromatic-L-amino-acid decarboxylase